MYGKHTSVIIWLDNRIKNVFMLIKNTFSLYSPSTTVSLHLTLLIFLILVKYTCDRYRNSFVVCHFLHIIIVKPSVYETYLIWLANFRTGLPPFPSKVEQIGLRPRWDLYIKIYRYKQHDGCHSVLKIMESTSCKMWPHRRNGGGF